MSSIPATPRTAALTNSISAIEMRLHLQQKEAFSSLQSQLAELLASRRQQEALLLARQGAQVPSPSQSAPNSPRQSLVNRVATTDLAASLLDSKLKQLKSSSSTKAKIKDGVEFSAKLSEKQHTIDQLHDEIKQLKSASPAADSSLIYGLMDLLLTLQPNMVINRIANLPGKLEPHFTMHPNSTLLFADISGYTALSQTLGSAGAAGTELLSKVRHASHLFCSHIYTSAHPPTPPAVSRRLLRHRHNLHLQIQRRRNKVLRRRAPLPLPPRPQHDTSRGRHSCVPVRA